MANLTAKQNESGDVHKDIVKSAGVIKERLFYLSYLENTDVNYEAAIDQAVDQLNPQLARCRFCNSTNTNTYQNKLLDLIDLFLNSNFDDKVDLAKNVCKLLVGKSQAYIKAQLMLGSFTKVILPPKSLVQE